MSSHILWLSNSKDRKFMFLISCVRVPALILLMNIPSKISTNLLWEHSFLEGVGFALSQEVDFCENSFSRVLARKHWSYSVIILLNVASIRGKGTVITEILMNLKWQGNCHIDRIWDHLFKGDFLKRYAYSSYFIKFPWMNKRWLTRRSHWNHQPAFLRGKHRLVT